MCRVGRSGLQSGVQNLLLQFRRERPARSLALFTLANGLDPSLGEGSPRCQNGRSGQACSLSDRVIRHALACQQDHLAFAGGSLWRRTRPSQRLQFTLLRLIHDKGGGTGEHTPFDNKVNLLSIIKWDGTLASVLFRHLPYGHCPAWR